MAVGGEIKVVMTLDNKDFTFNVEQSGKMIRQLVTSLKTGADASKNIDKSLNSLSYTVRGSIQTLGMLRFAIYDIRDAFAATAGHVIKASGEIERMTKLMEGLSKETTDAARKTEALRNKDFVFKIAQNAPFEIKAITDAFVKMKSVGIDPTQGKLQILIDSIAKFGGSSEHIHRASIAIQQMVGKGVISMEELRQQLGEAIPDAIQSMAIGTGMSMAELVKKISLGQVESVTALERMFEVMKIKNQGAAEGMMNTWVGQMERLKTVFTLFANSIGQTGFMSEITNQLKDMNDWFKTQDAAEFAKTIGISMKSVAVALKDALLFLREWSDWVIKIGQALLAVWAGNKLYTALTAIMSLKTAIAARWVAENQKIAASEVLKAKAIAEANLATRNAMAPQVEAGMQRVYAANFANRVEMAALRKQYMEKEVLRAQHLAAAEAAERISNTRRLADGTITSNKMIAQMKLEAAAYRAKAIEAGAAMTSIVVAANKVNAAHVTVAAGTAAVNAALNAALITTTTYSAALAALSRGVAFLGGPIGVISIALTAGMLAWAKWGNSGEESINKVNQALEAVKNNMADVNDLQTLQARAAALQIEKAALEKTDVRLNKNAIGLRTPNMDWHSTSMRAANKKNIEGNAAEIERIKDMIARASIQSEDKRAADAARLSIMRLDNLTRTQQMLVGAEIHMDVTAGKKRRDAKEITEEQFKQLESASYRVRQGNLYKVKIAAYEAETEKLTAAIGAATEKEKFVIMSSISAIAEAIKTTNADLLALDKIGTPPDLIGGRAGANKNKAEAKLQRVLDTLKAKKAELEAWIEGIRDAGVRLETLTKETAHFNTTDSNGKEQRPKQSTIDAAIKMAGEVEKLKTEQNKIKAAESSAAHILNRIQEITAAAKTSKDDAMDDYMALGFDAASRRISRIKQQLGALKTDLEANLNNMSKGSPLYEKTKAMLADWDSMGGVNESTSSMAVRNTAQFMMPLLQKARDIRAELQRTKIGGLQAEFEADMKFQTSLFNARIDSGQMELDTKKKFQDDWADYVLASTEKIVRATENPLTTLSRNWSDTTTRMRNASVGWANDSSAAIINFVKTGKFEFASLVESILLGMLRIQVEKQLAMAVDKAGVGLDFISQVVMGGIGAYRGRGVTPTSTANASGSAMLWPHAKGGVMSEFGPVQLRKYATGGIANSPQLALYGEGSQREAFVPLADGRSIPVTMKGGESGNAGAVVYLTVNNNASGTEATASQGKDKEGNLTLEVIIDKIESGISRNISKGSGSMAKTIENTYGLNRKSGSFR